MAARIVRFALVGLACLATACGPSPAEVEPAPTPAPTPAQPHPAPTEPAPPKPLLAPPEQVQLALANAGPTTPADDDAHRPITPTRSLVGHADEVYRLAWSPDEKLLLTASHDETTRLWDWTSGGHIAKLPAPTYRKKVLAFSPSGEQIVIAATKFGAGLWDVENREMITRDEFAGDASLVLGGRWLLYDDLGYKLRKLDGRRFAEPVRLPKSASEASAPAISPDGTRALLFTRGGWRLWSLSPKGGKPLADAPARNLQLAAWSADSRLVAIWMTEPVRTLEIRDRDGRHVAAIDAPITNLIRFSPDSKRIVGADWNRRAEIWGVEDGRSITALGHHSQRARDIAWTPDGELLAAVHGDEDVRLFDAASGRVVGLLTAPDDALASVAFTAEGELVASGVGVHVWEPAAIVASLQRHPTTHVFAAIDLAPNTVQAAAVTASGTTGIWSLATGELLRELETAGVGVADIAISADGRRVATMDEARSIRLWDTATGAVERTLDSGRAPATRFALSPSGERVALINAANQFAVADLVPRFRQNTVGATGAREDAFALTFGPGEAPVALGGPNGELVLRETNHYGKLDIPQRLRDAEGREPSSIHAIASAPLGTMLAAGGSHGRVVFVDVDSEKVLGVLATGDRVVEQLAFSPDGTSLAVGTDGGVEVWDVSTQTRRASVSTRPVAPLDLAWTSDGAYVYMAYADGQVLARAART